MALAGKTNREIAQRLYLQQRTVEIHLTNVYRKLGIRGRAQLPHAFATDETTERRRESA
jgi:DNA-binding CsgD family transcriptional regulator